MMKFSRFQPLLRLLVNNGVRMIQWRLYLIFQLLTSIIVIRAQCPGQCTCVNVTISCMFSFRQIALSNNTFQEYRNVTSLFISATDLPQGIFDNLIHLRDLTVFCTTLPENLFRDQSMLKDLQLNVGDTWDNGITLPAQLFYPLISLNSLTFEASGLSVLPSDLFTRCVALEELHFTFSGKSAALTVTDELFGALTSLIHLSVASNGYLVNLPPLAFQHLSLLETLDLSGASLGSGVFRGLNKLTKLDMSGNTHLQSLSAGTFEGCSSLEYLDLSHTACLTDINANAFEGLNQLRYLDLRNQVRWSESNYIPPGLFDACPLLNTLDLSNCYIPLLPQGIFSKLTNLTTLSLAGNQISFVLPDFCSSVRNVKFLDMANNYFGSYASGLPMDCFNQFTCSCLLDQSCSFSSPYPSANVSCGSAEGMTLFSKMCVVEDKDVTFFEYCATNPVTYPVMPKPGNDMQIMMIVFSVFSGLAVLCCLRVLIMAWWKKRVDNGSENYQYLA